MLPSMMFRRDVRTGSLREFMPFGHFSMAPALLVPIAANVFVARFLRPGTPNMKMATAFVGIRDVH
jgi:hypothetical protein